MTLVEREYGSSVEDIPYPGNGLDRLDFEHEMIEARPRYHMNAATWEDLYTTSMVLRSLTLATVLIRALELSVAALASIGIGKLLHDIRQHR